MDSGFWELMFPKKCNYQNILIMKKLLLIIILIGLGVWGVRSLGNGEESSKVEGERTGRVIYSFGLVSDSHLNNDGLAKAMELAKSAKVNRVFGLGDWTEYGEIEKLSLTKNIFEQSGLVYEVLPGDHDLANSRDLGLSARSNFDTVFGLEEKSIVESNIQFVLVDNSDIYLGIGDENWFEIKNILLTSPPKLRFVLAHKTPFNPDTQHIMGDGSEEVTFQAKQFLYLLENSKVNELFTGDLHHFARYSSPNDGVKITSIGALSTEKNFQGPNFVIVKVFENYSYEIENIQI